MSKVYNLISKDSEKLLEVLYLRRAGWALESLSEMYNIRRQSLRYQCRKYQIFPIKTNYIKNSNDIFNPKRVIAQIILQIKPVTTQWLVVDGERINQGKSYKDYLKDSKFSI